MTPNNLQEALVELDSLLSQNNKLFLVETIKEKGIEETAVQNHHTLGRAIRNSWGLWTNSPLLQSIKKETNLTHPDDISGYIIRKYLETLKP